MKKTHLAFLIFFSFTLISMSFQNCSEVKLSLMQPLSSVSQTGRLCISGDSKPIKNKVLFIIDKSGSNKLDQTQGGGSDLNAVIRIGSIKNFMAQYSSDPTMEWGLISFQGTSSKSYLKSSSGLPAFGTASQFQAAIATFSSEQDAGGTPYLSALALATQLIKNDISNPSNSAFAVNYQILFQSDGLPTDACINSAGCPASDAHFQAVTNLENAAGGSAYFSTVYYAPASWDANGDAFQGLSKMATLGHGKSLNLSSSGSNVIDIKSLLNIAPSKVWQLKQFQVYNLNSAMCDDGSIGVDSDSDGICDQDEKTYNTLFASNLSSYFGSAQFDPTSRNSLDPTYSDYFAKQVLIGNSYLPSCATGFIDSDHDLITDCEESLIQNHNPTGLTPQWTQSLISQGGIGNPSSPDSDGDGFIDSISLFGFGSISAPLNYNNSIRMFATGVTGYDIIHEHRNPSSPSNYDSSSYDTTLTPVGYNELGEHCYDFHQTQLKLYPTLPVTDTSKLSGMANLVHDTGENIILVYYIAVPENDPNTQNISFRYSFQKLKYDPNTTYPISLDFGNFRTFKVGN